MDGGSAIFLESMLGNSLGEGKTEVLILNLSHWNRDRFGECEVQKSKALRKKLYSQPEQQSFSATPTNGGRFIPPANSVTIRQIGGLLALPAAHVLLVQSLDS